MIKAVTVGLFCSAWPALSLAVCLHGDLSPDQELAKSKAVVVGTVLSEARKPASKNYEEGIEYIVRIEKTIKGKAKKKVRLFSENSSGRFPMKKGVPYLLFIYEELGLLHVDNCGNSGPLSEKQSVLLSLQNMGNK